MGVQGASEGVQAAALRLLEAATARVACPPVRHLLQPGGVEQGYAVQKLIVNDALCRGRSPVGRKIGLTSESVQRQLGVNQPDYGVLFADMAVTAGGSADVNRLLQPRVEAEIAFVLASDLDGPVTAEQVREAVSHAVAAIEVVDSRIADWDITITDTVADNASCGLFALSDRQINIRDLDLTAVRMEMVDEGGAVVSSGAGAECLGDPLEAVAWLAQTASRLGNPLRAGEFILSGALGPMVNAEEGRRFTATLSSFGELSLSFVSGKER